MPPRSKANKRRDYNQLLQDMAIIIEERMVEFGADPRDPTDVDVFVNGLAISKKLKNMISVQMDKE